MKCAVGGLHHVKELRELMREHKALVLKEMQLAFQAEVRARDKPFITLPQVETWKIQYKSPERRYKCLVLHGGSLFGKTAFAMNLWGEKSTFYVGMQGKSEPDLRDYDALLHKAIVFDEMSLAKVIELKRVMQAPDEPVRLGTSATNIHSYEVWFGGKALIITTNRYEADLDSLDADDRAWVTSNCVAVKVTRKLYVNGVGD